MRFSFTRAAPCRQRLSQDKETCSGRLILWKHALGIASDRAPFRFDLAPGAENRPSCPCVLVLQEQRHVGSGYLKTRRPAQADLYYGNMLWELPMTEHHSDLTWHLALKIGLRAHAFWFYKSSAR